MSKSGSKQHGLVRWFWANYVRAEAAPMFSALFLMALEGGMLGGLAWMIRPLFDRVFIGGDSQAASWVAAIVFAMFTLRAVAGFSQRLLAASAMMRILTRLQSRLVRHLMDLDSNFFQSNPPGELIERVRGDAQTFQINLQHVLETIGRDIFALVALLAVAFWSDWQWTLIAFVGVPVLVIPLAAVQHWIHKTSIGARGSSARLSTRLDEIFHLINPIKVNVLEEHESGRFSDELNQFRRMQTRSIAGQAALPAIIDIIAAIGFLGVLIYGGREIIAGEKSVGQFMSFFTALGLIFEPMRQVSRLSGAWQASLASLGRMRELFEMEPVINSPQQPHAAPNAAGEIRLADVSFSYPDHPVLNGVSFSVPVGKTTALVGASGAGKSTIFNLLTRLIDPDDGKIAIGDVELSAFSLSDLRSHFSVVAQEGALFDETIRDNIASGRRGADAQAIARAADAAFVSDFLDRLPAGIESPAGPRGSALSGGQRQRVAIARAVLRDAPVLLLDEPTSALDADSEARVQAALDKLAEGRTTIVIAHRLATVLNADQIVVMDKGRVVDSGSHAELLERGGIYARLYRLQFNEDPS